MFWSDTASAWRELAAQQCDLGADAQACTLEWCAADLEQRAREWESERLTLDEAAVESGYSRDHLSRLLSDETIPNAGEPYAPRIRRFDLPRKPGHAVGPARRLDEPVGSRVQMARSVVESE